MIHDMCLISDNNYSYAFWISSALLGVSSLIHFAAFFLKRVQQARK